MGAIYRLLGLTVECLPEHAQPHERLIMAGTDIVYVTGPSVAWTFLWDNHHMHRPETVVRSTWHKQRRLHPSQQHDCSHPFAHRTS